MKKNLILFVFLIAVFFTLPGLSQKTWEYLKQGTIPFGGKFVQLDDLKWKETTDKGSTFFYEKWESDDKSITLFDASRQLYVKLTADACFNRPKSGQWKKALVGAWVIPITNWVYKDQPNFAKSGSFKIQTDGKWKEQNAKGEVFIYQEFERIEGVIVLSDPSRGIYVKLTQTECYFKKKGGNWEKYYNGKWE